MSAILLGALVFWKMCWFGIKDGVYAIWSVWTIRLLYFRDYVVSYGIAGFVPDDQNRQMIEEICLMSC